LINASGNMAIRITRFDVIPTSGGLMCPIKEQYTEEEEDCTEAGVCKKSFNTFEELVRHQNKLIFEKDIKMFWTERNDDQFILTWFKR